MDSILGLFYCSHLWVWRRIETVVLLDKTTVRREIALDFELPPWTEKGGFEPDRLFLVPIGVFHGPLGHLRVVDHQSGRITILNREEDDVLLAHFLWRLVGKGVRLQTCKEAIRDRTIDNLVPTGTADLDERRMLLAALKADIAKSGHLMVAVLPATPHRRRLLTVSYEERLDRLPRKPEDRDEHERSVVALIRKKESARRPRRVRLTEWAGGFRSTLVVWPHWSLGDIVSTHIEFESPRELEVTAAGLFATKLDGDPERLPTREVGPRAFLTVRPREHNALECLHRHPYWRRGDLAVFSAAVRVHASPLLRAGWFLAWSTAALFAFGAEFMRRLVNSGSVDAMATIIVVVPGLAAGFLASRSEHAFAAWQLRGIRVRIAVIGVAAAVAAASLAFWGQPTVQRVTLASGAKPTVVLLQPAYAWVQVAWWAMAAICVLVGVMLACALWIATHPATDETLAARDPYLIVKSGEAKRDVSPNTAEQLAEAACRLFHFPDPTSNGHR
ncbi:MAG: hypothetical protein ACLP8S_08180 [Solirubrobacteraceae bacterium]